MKNEKSYSNHLNTRQVWYSNGTNMSCCHIVFFNIMVSGAFILLFTSQLTVLINSLCALDTHLSVLDT